LAKVGAVVGLLVYLLPIYAAVPRPGQAGGGDRAPGIVFARYRPAQLDAATDEGPLPRPSVSALPLATVPATLVPELTGSSRGGDGGALASRPASPGRSRSPPVV
jgi:hypothetical protein